MVLHFVVEFGVMQESLTCCTPHEWFHTEKLFFARPQAFLVLPQKPRLSQASHALQILPVRYDIGP
jgi:hypothetical protein